MKFHFIILLLFYFFGILFFSSIFFLSFHLPLFSEEKVLFYRGLKLLFLIAFLFFLIIFYVKKSSLINLSWETLISFLVVSFSLNLVFFVVFPVTFERSVTMFLLNKVNGNQGIGKRNLEKMLIEEYILKNKALEKRINEQTKINFLTIKNNQVFLTEKGLKFLNLSLFLKKIYGIK